MDSIASLNPSVGVGTSPALPEHLRDFLKPPALRDPQAQGNEVPLPQDISLSGPDYIQSRWDQARLTVLPRIATPGILLGVVITFIGLTGLGNCITGHAIPGLEFIVNNMPVSLAFSLTMIRAGLHITYKCILRSRERNRERQEVTTAWTRAQISDSLRMDTEFTPELLTKMNQSLPTELRIDTPRAANEINGKEHADLPLQGMEFAMRYRETLFQAPSIRPPGAQEALVIHNRELTIPKTGWNHWYEWWYNRLPLIGKMDILFGQFMFVAAVLGMASLTIPGSLPVGIGFEMFTKDPTISVSFAFLLLVNWIDCTRTGWRMIGFKKREEKRSAQDREMQMIALALNPENKRAIEFHLWMRERVRAMGRHDLDEVLEKALPSCFIDELSQKKETSYLEKYGACLVPKLANLAIFLGILTTIIGATLLTLSILKEVPASLEFIAANTPLSIIFSACFLACGIHTIHRGAVMDRRKVKESWKKEEKEVRKQIRDLLLTPPQLQPPQSPPSPTARTVRVGIIERKGVESPLPLAGVVEKKGLWLNSLKVLWVPDFCLGLFLLYASITGIAICAGATPPAYLEFIAEDPSLTFAFALSSLGIAIDALSTSWRIGSYHMRERADSNSLEILKNCYSRLNEAQGANLARG